MVGLSLSKYSRERSVLVGGQRGMTRIVNSEFACAAEATPQPLSSADPRP